MGIRQFDVMNLGRAGLMKPDQLGYLDSLEIIKDESYKIQKSFVKIGWYLKHIRDRELYHEGGYANVWECAADQLGYSKSTASRFINICEKFSKDHNSPELDEKYADFDKSQMIEMLPMEPEQLDRISPDMTVKQIRDMKSEQKTDDSIPGQTSIEEDFPEYLPERQKKENVATSQQPERETEFVLEEESVATSQQSERETESVLEEESVATSQQSERETGFMLEEESVAILQQQPDEATEFVSEEKIVATSQQELIEIEPQPELPVLKNNDMRKKWLADYKAWGLWYRDDHIDVNYYKYDFEDGSRLVVAEYPQRYEYWSDKRSDEHYYHLLEKNRKGYKKKIYDEQYRNHTDAETYLVEFLKNLQK